MNYGNAHVNRSDGSILIESKPWMMDITNNFNEKKLHKLDKKNKTPGDIVLHKHYTYPHLHQQMGLKQKILFSQKDENLVGKSIIK